MINEQVNKFLILMPLIISILKLEYKVVTISIS